MSSSFFSVAPCPSGYFRNATGLCELNGQVFQVKFFFTLANLIENFLFAVLCLCLFYPFTTKCVLKGSLFIRLVL